MIRSEEPDSFAAVSLAIAKIRLYVLKDQARSLGELAATIRHNNPRCLYFNVDNA